jgi:hypothetical protein
MVRAHAGAKPGFLDCEGMISKSSKKSFDTGSLQKIMADFGCKS